MSTDLRLSDEQQELGALLDALLERHAGSAAVRAAVDAPRGYDERLWSLLCDQVGVTALPVPEAYDGAGCGFVESALVLERLGYALAPAPLLGTTVATAALLGLPDPSTVTGELLRRIAGGETATVVWDGATGAARTSVLAVDGRLTGEATYVLDGDTAGILLVAAGTTAGAVLHQVDLDSAGLSRAVTPAMDHALRLARVTLDAVPGTPLGPVDLGALLAVGAAGVAACAVGVAQRGLDLTVAYSKERVQFGRPIGSFQALKHRMADMLVQVETARSAALDAAVAVAEGTDAARRAAVAKAWCSEACQAVASETVQLHGGIAITWEHDAQLVFKRAHALGQLFGPAHLHRATLV